MVGDYMAMERSVNKQFKVIIDTSALINLSEGFDFFSRVEQEFGDVKYIVPTSVMDELKRLAESNPKYARCLKLIMRIIDLHKISVVYTGNKKAIADDDLLEMDGDLFITNDLELAQKLKNQNKKIFILKKNKYYDFY